MDKSEKLLAVLNSDKNYDGKFFYGVLTTGIFCRPSCKSRNPSPDNIVFFDTSRQAENAGFRPCKRCRPDLISYTPDKDLASEVAVIIGDSYYDRQLLQTRLKQLPVTRRHLTKLFEKQYGMSIAQYTANVRFNQACALIKRGKSITDVAMETGFETSSAFNVFFKKYAGVSPVEYNRQQHTVIRWLYYNTVAGTVRIEEDNTGITSLKFVDSIQEDNSENSLYLTQACCQLEEYFAGERKAFDIPLSLKGTDFQKKVWYELKNIPYGETRTYKEIACEIGNPAAARAVGSANNRNPILIFIPCHRVVGKNNKLVGYAGGIERKELLLNMEKSFCR